MKLNSIHFFLSFIISLGSYAGEQFRFSEKDATDFYARKDSEHTEEQKENLFSDYNLSPLRKHMSFEEYETFKNQISAPSSRKSNSIKGRAGNVITIDTRDGEACERVKSSLVANKLIKASNNICRKDPEQPYVSITFLNSETVEYRTYLENFSAQASSDRVEKIKDRTRNFIGAGIVSMGILYALPESVTNWDRDEFAKELTSEWGENVSSPPVVDKDPWVINYVLHPLAGMAYHVVARHAGFSGLESFGYSVLMSTFFWEYGIEALVEKPSLQDLIITPLIGSLLGELFYQLELKIKEDKGKFLNSKLAGTIITGIANHPEHVLDFLNHFFEAPVFEDFRAYLFIRDRKAQVMESFIDNYATDNSFGVGFELRF